MICLPENAKFEACETLNVRSPAGIGGMTNTQSERNEEIDVFW